MEQHLPDNLSTHYAIVYTGDRPVVLVVAQSLEIRVADLSPGRLSETTPGFWHSLGKASQPPSAGFASGSCSTTTSCCGRYERKLRRRPPLGSRGQTWPGPLAPLSALVEGCGTRCGIPGCVGPLAFFSLRKPALDGSARLCLCRGRRPGEALAGGRRGA